MGYLQTQFPKQNLPPSAAAGYGSTVTAVRPPKGRTARQVKIALSETTGCRFCTR